jgi:hypothetical protein
MVRKWSTGPISLSYTTPPVPTRSPQILEHALNRGATQPHGGQVLRPHDSPHSETSLHQSRAPGWDSEAGGRYFRWPLRNAAGKMSFPLKSDSGTYDRSPCTAPTQQAAPCELEGCSELAQGGTHHCAAHGGGRRCQEDGCTLVSCSRPTRLCLRFPVFEAGGGKKPHLGSRGVVVSFGLRQVCQHARVDEWIEYVVNGQVLEGIERGVAVG